MKNKKTQYTATAPNGDVLSVTSTRPLVECHVAINKETNATGAYRWTIKRQGKASASSCGYSFGYVGSWCTDAAKYNAEADKEKALRNAKYTFHIVPVVAA